MNQKINDLILLLKNDRKYQVLCLVAIVGLVVSLVLPGKEPPLKKPTQPASQTVARNATGHEEAAKDLARSFDQRLNTMQSNVSQIEKKLGDLQRQGEESTQRTAAILTKFLDRLQEAENTAKNASAVGGAGVNPEVINSGGVVGEGGDPGAYGGDGGAEFSPAPDEQGIESFGATDQPIVAPPPAPKTGKAAIIAAGDSVRIKLLAGVNAPTDGTPYPVVFKLVDDVVGPDGSALPLGEARLIAAAQGSLADSRALFRLTTLSMRYPDGRRQVVEVDGWVVGEDGIRGMEGVLIDPLSKVLVASGLMGFVEGMGNALAAKNVQVTENPYGGSQVAVTGDETEYAAGLGLSDMSRQYNRLIESRLKKLTPHVQVLSGREATAVFARSVKVPALYDMIESGEQDIYNPLD